LPELTSKAGEQIKPCFALHFAGNNAHMENEECSSYPAVGGIAINPVSHGMPCRQRQKSGSCVLPRTPPPGPIVKNGANAKLVYREVTGAFTLHAVGFNPGFGICPCSGTRMNPAKAEIVARGSQ